MIPIYAIVSILSLAFYRHFIYFQVLRDCYEAIAIASFFALLCHYIAPSLHDQKEHFRTLQPREWIFPLRQFKSCCGGDRGPWRTPRSGLTWFNVSSRPTRSAPTVGRNGEAQINVWQVVWLGIFQYCFIRVFFTVVSVVTQLTGRFCETSLHPAFAHVWVRLGGGGEAVVLRSTVTALKSNRYSRENNRFSYSKQLR